jgi:hypothetical protein
MNQHLLTLVHAKVFYIGEFLPKNEIKFFENKMILEAFNCQK